MNERTASETRAEQIRREHDELRQLLGSVRRTLADRLETVASVAEKLSELCEHVETHFAEEETGGFFDQVLEKEPRFGERTQALQNEHVQLLAAVRKLAETSRAEGDSDDWWLRVEGEFHEFSKDLMRHESKENELLQDTLSVDIGAAD